MDARNGIGSARMHRGAALGLAAALLQAGAAAAQRPEGATPPARIGPIWDGRQHQPTRQGTEEQLRREGVAPEPQERQSELRELNEISRELLPPGSPLPAPGLEQDRRTNAR